MRPVGFSTGALARGDFRRALELLSRYETSVVELSALRLDELEPLVEALPHLDLRQFSFISIHVPTLFAFEREGSVIERLILLAEMGYPLVVHPDTIFTPRRWEQFGDKILIENMDKRRPVGRNVTEMSKLFTLLPDARFCFDVGHARQVDPSMTEASLLLQAFGRRLAEVHISEVNTASRHDPISWNAVIAFRSIARYIPEEVPIILEPLIDAGQSDIETEIQRARDALVIYSYSPG
jgi:hypothetical protein